MDKFTKEMRTTYNFGDFESASTRRDGHDASASSTFTPREGGGAAASSATGNRGDDDDDDRHGAGTTSRTSNGAGAATEAAATAPAAATTVVTITTKDGRGGGDKTASGTHIVKEVLGLNKAGSTTTTTKRAGAGEQLSLEERWRNALAEEARLQELEQRTVAGEAQTQSLSARANFPPAVLCIRPLVYHSLDEPPTDERRRFVRIAFADWLAVCALLVVNAGVTIGVTFAPNTHRGADGETTSLRAKSTVLAIVYMVGLPLSFLLWYWRVYRACCTGRPTEYMLALAGLLLALAQGIFVVVAPAYYGVCSIALAQRVHAIKATGVVVPVIVVLVLWAAQCVMTVYLLVMTFIYYRRDLTARRVARTFASVVAA